MTVALVLTCDDRFHYLNQALNSIRMYVNFPFTVWRIADDSAKPNVRWPDGWEVISHPEKRGLAACVQTAWSNLPLEIDFVFHTECDFVFTQHVDIDAMAMMLSQHPQLAQLVLKRQPGSPEEARAGGIIETCPEAYTDRDGFVEHQRIFSLNPSLIPRWVIDRGWPDHGSEGDFTKGLVDDGFSFGFWGKRADPPRVLHIGSQRGTGWML